LRPDTFRVRTQTVTAKPIYSTTRNNSDIMSHVKDLFRSKYIKICAMRWMERSGHPKQLIMCRQRERES
jgi:hypothetical protein